MFRREGQIGNRWEMFVDRRRTELRLPGPFANRADTLEGETHQADCRRDGRRQLTSPPLNLGVKTSHFSALEVDQRLLSAKAIGPLVCENSQGQRGGIKRKCRLWQIYYKCYDKFTEGGSGRKEWCHLLQINEERLRRNHVVLRYHTHHPDFMFCLQYMEMYRQRAIRDVWDTFGEMQGQGFHSNTEASFLSSLVLPATVRKQPLCQH